MNAVDTSDLTYTNDLRDATNNAAAIHWSTRCSMERFSGRLLVNSKGRAGSSSLLEIINC
jgi:hypothetical protein